MRTSWLYTMRVRVCGPPGYVCVFILWFISPVRMFSMLSYGACRLLTDEYCPCCSLIRLYNTPAGVEQHQCCTLKGSPATKLRFESKQLVLNQQFVLNQQHWYSIKQLKIKKMPRSLTWHQGSTTLSLNQVCWSCPRMRPGQITLSRRRPPASHDDEQQCRFSCRSCLAEVFLQKLSCKVSCNIYCKHLFFPKIVVNALFVANSEFLENSRTDLRPIIHSFISRNLWPWGSGRIVE